MLSIPIHAHGDERVLRLADAPDPVPGPAEALIRVRACALNHLDLFIRQGLPGVVLPRILGSDIAGEIAALPPDAPAHWRLGQRVLLAPGSGCGLCHFCLAGRDNECRRYEMLGYHRDGGYAQLVRAPLKSLLPIPANLDFIQAASLPLVFLTAWNMLVIRAALQPGQSVLVWAASSGVGIAAIQIAKLFHCPVFATAGGPAKLELARRLGADAVADHYDPQLPVSRAVKAWRPVGVDVVVEHVGQASWDQSLRSLAPGGTLVTCGATTGPEAKIDLRFLFTRQLRLIGSYMGRRADLDTILSFFAAGALVPVVDKIFPLSEAPQAHQYLAAGKQCGKVLLQID